MCDLPTSAEERERKTFNVDFVEMKKKKFDEKRKKNKFQVWKIQLVEREYPSSTRWLRPIDKQFSDVIHS